MSEEERSGRAWARRGGRWVAAGAGVVVLLFFGSNLVVGSGWFRGKIEGRLTMRTRLSWTVEKVSWSPWGGVRARNLKATTVGPEARRIPPIVEIAEVRVQPYWRELLSGKVRVREVAVREPRGTVPLELLAQLMRSDGRVDAARLGSAARPAQPAPVPAPSGEGGKTEATDGGAVASGHGPDKPPPPPRKRDPEQVADEPELERPGRLLVHGGALELYGLAAPEKSLRMSGLQMDVPFSGGEAAGVLKAAAVQFAGAKFAGPLELPVRWKQGVIHWPAGEYEWNGMTVQTAGAVRVRGRLLGTVEMRVVAEQLGPQPVPGWDAVAFATGPLEMRARLTGDMIRPVTWQGNLVAGAQGVQISHSARGEAIVFEQGRLVTDLRGGVLQVVDTTLAGEQLSLFGNALLLMDGRIYGVGRVVAAPDVAESITRVAAGSMVSPGYVPEWMSPLGTPDRYYRDVYLQGQIPRLAFDLGPQRQWVDAERAMRLMRMFVVREEQEEMPMPGQQEEGGS